MHHHIALPPCLRKDNVGAVPEGCGSADEHIVRKLVGRIVYTLDLFVYTIKIPAEKHSSLGLGEQLEKRGSCKNCGNGGVALTNVEADFDNYVG
jgi:hypothetical protein